MMKKYYKYIIIALMSFGFVSCEFDDTNVDPNNPNPGLITNDLILPAAQAQAVFNIGALGGRMPGIVMQHFQGFDAQQVAYTAYVIEESDLNNLWQTGLYAAGMRDADIIINNGIEAENNFYIGVGKVLLAHNLGLATSFWGEIPLTEAFQGLENLTPAYDSQESIYAAIQTNLDEAITALGNTGDALTSGDIIFGGDAPSWIRVANAMKARYHMHLSKRNNNAAQNALNALAAGAMNSNDEIPYVVFDAAETGANPYAQFGTQRPKTMIVDARFEAIMTEDPRRDLYMVEDGDEWLFFEDTDPLETDLFWSTNTSPLPLISFTEQLFLEAEAFARLGQTDNAGDTLLAAVVANMEQLGVEEDDYSAYLNIVSTAFGAASGTDAQVEVIINEKYKALYCQGENEIWVDYRRTGYPALTPTAGGANGVNPSGIVPRRFLYPISERQFNDVSRQAAIDRQGGHLLDDDIWAFQ
ncbi:MAG: SusD/RagB family nutrient-binding outer membrane lipoprotein [Bacteroidota bacterium]